MQRHSIMPIRIKKVKIAFSKNMMTAYTGLSRMDSFFKYIRVQEAIELFRSILPTV